MDSFRNHFIFRLPLDSLEGLTLSCSSLPVCHLICAWSLLPVWRIMLILIWSATEGPKTFCSSKNTNQSPYNFSQRCSLKIIYYCCCMCVCVLYVGVWEDSHVTKWLWQGQRWTLWSLFPLPPLHVFWVLYSSVCTCEHLCTLSHLIGEDVTFNKAKAAYFIKLFGEPAEWPWCYVSYPEALQYKQREPLGCKDGMIQ